MTDLEELRNALIGDDAAGGFPVSRNSVSWGFALAVRSFTRWPVDAWAGVRDENGKLRTLYWIQGNTLGQLTAGADDSKLLVTGTVQPISSIGAVQIAAKVDEDDFSPGRARRSITVRVDDGEDITVDVDQCKGHLRVRANEFIDALLDAVNKTRVS